MAKRATKAQSGETEEDLLDDEPREDADYADISEEDRNLMREYYERDVKSFKEGEIIVGKVLRIGKESVLVDVGFKSEGEVNINEFPDRGRSLKVGDEIEIFLEKTEDKEGQIVLSKDKANKIKIWDKIAKAYEKRETLEGVIVSRAKGGLTVDIGLRAFLPGSQIDLRPVRNMDRLLGKKLEMKVIKMNKKRGNIVLSRRIILEEERTQAKVDTLANLEEGKVMEGIVKNITEYGVFVDLGGVDGLLHITDMSWGRVSHPSEMFAIGDKVNVMILKYDKEKERVSLGLKQISEDPWNRADAKYSPGTKLRGKVVSITDYGAFLELEQGIEGLVHISEMSWSKHLKHPSKMVAIGDTVEAVVLSLDKEKRRISLGMKQTESNPWENIEAKYPVSSVVEGKVRNLTDFGAFIELEDGVDGLIHISDMSWSKKVKHPSEVLKKRESVKAMVLSVDREGEKLSLGLKQLEEDPWEKSISKYSLGQDVDTKIDKITSFGVFGQLDEYLEGLIHVSQYGKDRSANPEKAFNVGDTVKCRIIKIDNEKRKIGLSVKAIEEGLSLEDFKETEIALIDQEQPSEEIEEKAPRRTKKAKDE
ncbi:MAG: 30S ribosomal protein S1 [Nitrospinae bacterium]|nr:30S ribosomal protein S1 [Nitrospinota bacterium]